MNIRFYSGENYPEDTIHSHVETKRALLRGGDETLNTTCHIVFNASLLEKGHTLTLVYPNGREESIAFGPNVAYGRILKPTHNLLNLFIAGEFDIVEGDAQ